ncbi:MAG: DUF4476 domain-containing protein [Bacteroidia bacterium]
MRFFLSIITGLLAISTIYARESSMRITMQDSSFFICEIRGTDYDKPQQEIVVHHLNPGLCNIRIQKLMKSAGGRTIPIEVYNGDVFLEDGFAHHFVLDNNNSLNLFDKYSIRNTTVKRSSKEFRTKPHISNARFNDEMSLLRAIRPEKRRYRVAMNMISTGMLTSNQINRMLTLFERPRLKMKIVEFGRIYVSDPSNYHAVADRFYLQEK